MPDKFSIASFKAALPRLIMLGVVIYTLIYMKENNTCQNRVKEWSHVSFDATVTEKGRDRKGSFIILKDKNKLRQFVPRLQNKDGYSLDEIANIGDKLIKQKGSIVYKLVKTDKVHYFVPDAGSACETGDFYLDRGIAVDEIIRKTLPTPEWK